MSTQTLSFTTEQVAIDQLRFHPRNYQTHPEDELKHIIESLHENGFYKNIVIANENTIIAGHGVVLAAQQVGYTHVPVRRMLFGPNDPRALKILAGDNEIRHLAEVDDRALTELLRELADEGDLLGTGYDDMMLANLVLVSRPESEIADMDAAAHWVGMPEYDEGEDRIQIIMNFATEEDCQEFCRMNNLGVGKTAVKGAKKSFWWPVRENDDVRSIKFTDQEKVSSR